MEAADNRPVPGLWKEEGGTVKKKPGEVFDIRGVPIYPGDLIRHYHFTGARKKRYYLYHVAVWNAEQETMEIVPVYHLEPSKAKEGGRCWLTENVMMEPEVIHGYGPPGFLSFEDRPRKSNLLYHVDTVAEG